MNKPLKIFLLLGYVIACGCSVLWLHQLGRGGEIEVEIPTKPLAKKKPALLTAIIPKSKPIPRELSDFELAADERFSGSAAADMGDFTQRIREAAGSGTRLDADTLLMIGQLEAEDFPAALEAALALPIAQRNEILKAVLARWAMFEPQEAFDFAIEHFARFELFDGIAGVLGTWASHDGEGAFKRVREWIESESRMEYRHKKAPKDAYEMMQPLFFGWAKSDLDEAAASAGSLTNMHQLLTAWDGIGAAANIRGGRDEAIAHANSLSDEVPRGAGIKPRWVALGQIVGAWADEDPVAAAAWVSENGYHVRDQGFFWHPWWEVYKQYKEHDLEAASNWMIQNPADEADLSKTKETAILNWARVDVEAAAAWLEEVGPMDAPIKALAEIYASIDLEKAMDWAQRASDAERDEIIAWTLAKGAKHHSLGAIVPFLGSGSLSPDAMAVRVKKINPSAGGAFD